MGIAIHLTSREAIDRWACFAGLVHSLTLTGTVHRMTDKTVLDGDVGAVVDVTVFTATVDGTSYASQRPIIFIGSR